MLGVEPEELGTQRAFVIIVVVIAVNAAISVTVATASFC